MRIEEHQNLPRRHPRPGQPRPDQSQSLLRPDQLHRMILQPRRDIHLQPPPQRDAVLAKIVHENNLVDQITRRPIQNAPNRPEYHRERLLVENQYDGHVPVDVVRFRLAPAEIKTLRIVTGRISTGYVHLVPGVLQRPIQRNPVAQDDVHRDRLQRELAQGLILAIEIRCLPVRPQSLHDPRLVLPDVLLLIAQHLHQLPVIVPRQKPDREEQQQQ